MRRIWRDNGLTIVLLAMFLAVFVGQILAGYRVYNHDQRDHGEAAIGLHAYLATPHFLEATAENWESEFLQMGIFVMLTAVLYQRGSAESRDPDGESEGDREPDPRRPGAPAAVRRGGFVLALYRRSLALTFYLFFLVSFGLHALGGAGAYNAEQASHGSGSRMSVVGYMGSSRFWFESFQNWQSEFLSIAAMVVLTIFLRQQGSPESKPVDAPHSRTGTG